jgi:hypothetical protein
MSTTAVDLTEKNAAAEKAQTKPEQHASPKRAVDKFAEARLAKKKERRARHRARLKRSHTNG